MKILIVTEFFYPHFGGVEQVFFEVGKRLVNQGHDVTIFTTQETQSFHDPHLFYRGKSFLGRISYYDLYGMSVVRLQIPNFLKRYLFALLGFPFLFYLSLSTDLIHSSNNYTVALGCFLVSKILRKPVTISVWEIWSNLWFSFYFPSIGCFFWLYEKIILSLPFDFFITPSRYVYNQIKSIPINKKRVIYLGGKTLRFDKKHARILRKKYQLNKKFTFLYYGRLAKSKGVKTLIDAFPKVIQESKKCFLILFVSNLNQKNKKLLKKYIQNNHLTKYIQLHSYIPEADLAAHLSLADSVIVPDVTHSFGLSALECCILGRPLVTTTGGALPEVVYGKIVFVTPRSTADLARGMIDAYHGKFNRIPKKHFSLEKTASEYEKVFKITFAKVTNSVYKS